MQFYRRQEDVVSKVTARSIVQAQTHVTHSTHSIDLAREGDGLLLFTTLFHEKTVHGEPKMKV
jgi:hypothetical protein